MMARIHLRHRSFSVGNQTGEPGTGSDLGGMSMGNGTPRLMIHLGLDVLDQCAVAPDVERLGAVADAKNGLLQVEGILKQEFIDSSAGGVGLTALRDRIFAKSLWVYVIAAAGQEDALNPAKQSSDAIRALV